MPRILVVDDDPQLCLLARHMLEQAGYEVSLATDGSEALQRYRACPSELVITDLVMPQKDGLELIRALRREAPAVKIIAMSANGPTKKFDLLDVAMAFGADCTLEKPFTRRQLLTLVHEVIPPV